MYIAKYQSPIGEITIASNGQLLTGLWFAGQKNFGSTLSENYEMKDLPVFEKTRHWLDVYFDGREPDIILPLQLVGTEFCKMVWDVLLTIPYGKTMTYGEIASVIARKKDLKRMSAQAVGRAVGLNPISILVPCHRVIGSHGDLIGYAGGLDRKEKLLELERCCKR